MSVIRQLCQKLGAPAAPHHIFAGVSSILSSQDMASNGKAVAQSSATKTPALIVAVYVWVTARLAWSEAPAVEYQQQRNSAVEMLKGLAQVVDEMRSFDHDDVDTCMHQIVDNQWTKMDWFENVPAGTGLGVGDGLKGEGEHYDGLDNAEEGLLLPVEQREVDKSGAADQDYLQAGLGTMVWSCSACLEPSANTSSDARSGGLPKRRPKTRIPGMEDAYSFSDRSAGVGCCGWMRPVQSNATNLRTVSSSPKDPAQNRRKGSKRPSTSRAWLAARHVS